MNPTPGLARQQLTELLARIDDQTRVLKYLPKWVTMDRLYALLDGDRRGTLSPLQSTELASILELVPAIVANLTGYVPPALRVDNEQPPERAVPRFRGGEQLVRP